MRKSTQFLYLTVVIDILLLGSIGALGIPVDPQVQSFVAVFVVSPVLTFLVVFRGEYREVFSRFSPPEDRPR